MDAEGTHEHIGPSAHPHADTHIHCAHDQQAKTLEYMIAKFNSKATPTPAL